MESILKGFTGIFFLLVLTCFGISIIGSSIRSTKASQALLAYVSRIENSNYSDQVISSCKADAREQFGEDGREALDVVTAGQKGHSYQSYGRVTLNYTYRIPVIGYSSKHAISSVIG
ncbi:hypothetical protein [Candidatus Weimeria sp. HCP3S3_B5]|uniref:hypothetical protein n=1 Tax=Candidatus Weimeria sp. HCP3S3_B5 TaxID=3438871 RepID=UPI002A9BAF4A|nr:hypothetical protein [Lachnospiraceae bacterium]